MLPFPGHLPAMPAHHLHDEGALMRIGGAHDRVDRLDDPVQGRVRADGHVGAAEVVIDGADLGADAISGR